MLAPIKTLSLLAVFATTCSVKACPVWFNYNNGINKCSCGKPLGGVVNCDNNTKEVSLLYCYCMTFNHQLNKTFVGACSAMCTWKETPNCPSFNKLQTNDTMELNQVLCSDLNRKGQLCGRCIEGYAPQAYSYSLECIPCSEKDFARNLAKYIAIAFLPLTVFYFLVTALRISITSGDMVVFILTSQLITTPINTRNMVSTMSTATLLLMACFSLWNLDFLRSVYSPFCLHPKMNTMHMIALDYLVGIYPLFLILLTCIIVIIFDRFQMSFRPLRVMNSTLSRFSHGRQSMRSSLVQSFASFLVLSYTKILNVSFDLLFPVNLRDSEGNNADSLYLYNNAEIAYFSPEHMPFAIIAILMLIVFNLLPLILLLLYPCRCFHRCLGRRVATSPMLFAFMDAFQGCYRHKPRDCRYFAGFYLFLRILQLVTFAAVRDYIYIVIMGFYFLIITGALVLIEPYKEKIQNKTDQVFFLLYASAYFLTAFNAYLRPSEPQVRIHQIYTISICLLSTIPLVYVCVVLSRKLLPTRVIEIVKSCLNCNICCKRKSYPEVTTNESSETVDENTPLLMVK